MKTAGSKNVRNQMAELGLKHLSTGGATKAQSFAHSRDAARSMGALGVRDAGADFRQQSRGLLGSMGKTAMDKEVAVAVLDRWDQGEPVSEVNLYKAASALGIDPMAALVEARFYTYLDSCLLEKRAMSLGERAVFSAAAGLSSGIMTKTASAHGFSPDELILEALRDRGFVPNLEKIADLSTIMQQQQGGGQMPPPGAMPPPGGAPPPGAPMDPSAQAGDAMMAPPDPNAMMQQQPDARVKPSPTGPEQTPASPGGNLDELVQQGQQIYGDQAMGNGGTAPQGMPQPAPPPPSPEERIQQVGPNLDPETVSRYAEQLQRFEDGFQMQIADPKQMVKFVKELQKVDGKKVDQGIKAMGQQLEQEQAQELGVDATPTIDGPGGGAGAGGPGMGMSPKGPPPGAEEAPPQEEPPQGGPSQAQSNGGDPSASAQSAGPPGNQAPPVAKKPPPQQAAQPNAAVEKVANAARALARASVPR